MIKINNFFINLTVITYYSFFNLKVIFSLNFFYIIFHTLKNQKEKRIKTKIKLKTKSF